MFDPYTIKWIIVVWALSGFLFWLDTIRYNGLPVRWKSIPRFDGWDVVLFIYLPLAIVIGPICWLVLVVTKLREE